MKTIILDFDGTVADSFKVAIDIAHKMTKHPSLINQGEVKELKRDSMIEVADRLGVPKYRLPFLVFKGRRQMTKRLKEIQPFDGIEEVLAKLHEDGYKIFIMSTNSSTNIKGFLSSHALKHYISKIYGGVGLLSKAGAMNRIMKQNKLDPSEVIYVGDEVRDIEASKSANVDVVAVTWGYNDSDRLKDEQPNFLVRTRPELLKVLESWESSKDML